jgi:hypothetical protein
MERKTAQPLKQRHRDRPGGFHRRLCHWDIFYSPRSVSKRHGRAAQALRRTAHGACPRRQALKARPLKSLPAPPPVLLLGQ